jgi:hypothetical protein
LADRIEGGLGDAWVGVGFEAHVANLAVFADPEADFDVALQAAVDVVGGLVTNTGSLREVGVGMFGGLALELLAFQLDGLGQGFRHVAIGGKGRGGHAVEGDGFHAAGADDGSAEGDADVGGDVLALKRADAIADDGDAAIIDEDAEGIFAGLGAPRGIEADGLIGDAAVGLGQHDAGEGDAAELQSAPGGLEAGGLVLFGHRIDELVQDGREGHRLRDQASGTEDAVGGDDFGALVVGKGEDTLFVAGRHPPLLDGARASGNAFEVVELDGKLRVPGLEAGRSRRAEVGGFLQLILQLAGVFRAKEGCCGEAENENEQARQDHSGTGHHRASKVAATGYHSDEWGCGLDAIRKQRSGGCGARCAFRNERPEGCA